MNVTTILGEKGVEVITTNPEATLLDVAKRLREYGIGCIVVENGKGGIAGIVSERDLVRAIAASGADILKAPVSRCMTKKVVTCQKSDTIEALMAAMTDGRFRHMPVVEGSKLVGLISIGDVVRSRIAETELEAAAMRDYIATG
ncbi:MAG TPA: CBS domain-containing protein [Rhizobiales bacterium]|nr:hypoxic response protein 1 [bacterium BMS3Bbin10]HDO51316.1 CBS domain-containing protein [Hyphomicrobiales bacterium]